MKKFYVFSAGCIRRGLDVIHLQSYLERNGWDMSRKPETADMIIVATCGVVELNEENSLRAIHEAVARRGNKNSLIVVTGCLPLINAGPMSDIRDCVFVPTGQLEKFDELINAITPFEEVEYPDSIADNPDIVNYLVARSFCRKSKLYKRIFYKFFMNGKFLEYSVRGKSLYEKIKSLAKGNKPQTFIPYYNIKIADGCLSQCAFCATKYATGTLRSRPLEDVFHDFKKGIDKGYKTFQLIAEDTGCYGKDINSSLAELIKSLCSYAEDFNLIIIDCNPQWLIEDRDTLLPVIVRHQENIKELFVPLQSGSNSVLESMKREYKAQDALDTLKEINERAPEIALRTSLLIGFPGETEEDFQLSRKAAKALGFAEVTVNRYEDRPKAVSSSLPQKVDSATIEKRAAVLSEDGCYILS
ncbi:radical SAM protein [Desulfovibrio oxyclinae]|uniref:radical SAM protein n=1 Tax=Desulfovibrio oxyclinae TaxID=63560 RepID=UPI0003734A9F|nr:radical SAM protein [Desulfovibrio oxyclinae]